MSQARRRRVLRKAWLSHDELLLAASALIAEGVGLSEAARRLDYPRETLRLLAEREDLAFPRKGQGNPGQRQRAFSGLLVEEVGAYRDATHPLDRPLCPEVLDLLRRPWL